MEKSGVWQTRMLHAANKLTIDFGIEGNSDKFLGEGWSVCELTFRWMTGTESELRIESSVVDGDCILELDLHPYLMLPTVPVQRLSIVVNGRVVGQSAISKGCRVGYRIPAAAANGGRHLSVTLMHPDAVRPCDISLSKDKRPLSFSVQRVKISPLPSGGTIKRIVGTGGVNLEDVERLVGMEPAKFISKFESLGNNCEFGLVQRLCGAETFLSLLRFAGAELPVLFRALDSGLQDFADLSHLTVCADDKARPEFVVHETRYGLFFHTFRYVDETSAEKLRASESKRLAYCARRFIADLRKGNKILVVKRNEPLEEQDILPLYAAVSSFGPNLLLWLVPADAQHPSGSVEAVVPGLLKGYIERFAPHEDAYDLLFEHWLEVCANAYRFSLADGMGSVKASLGRVAKTVLPRSRKIWAPVPN